MTLLRGDLNLAVFLFLIALLISLFSHGRFLCDSRTFFGMHSFIMLTKFEYHLSQERFMSSVNIYHPSQRALYFLTSFAPVSVGLVPDCNVGGQLPYYMVPLIWISVLIPKLSEFLQLTTLGLV